MTKMEAPPTGLLGLPTEIFLEIAALLRTPDLRRLGRCNRGLHSFVGHYLTRYRYNAGLLALPNELVLLIVERLEYQQHRSRFARVSHRLYPLVMSYIVSHDVNHDGSTLLKFAAWANRPGIARQIIRHGGNVDTRHEGTSMRFLKNTRLTPLAIAAFYGYKRIVKILLDAGASQSIDGKRVALMMAIAKRHEAVAVMLSQELEVCEIVHNMPGLKITVLQLASVEKLVKLVQFYLGRASRCRDCSQDLVRGYSISMCMVLRKDASRGDIIKRELLEDAHNIVMMLLEHGADPNCLVELPGSSIPSRARDIAAKHPDPRIRNLLVSPKSVMTSRESNLMIGRPWLLESEYQALSLHEPRSEVTPTEGTTSARLSDFVKRQDADASDFFDEEAFEEDCDYGEDDRSLEWGSPSLGSSYEAQRHWLEKDRDPVEPPPLAAFPQLATPTKGASNTSNKDWANHLRNISMKTPPARQSGTRSINSPHMKRLQGPAKVEDFPQLGQCRRTSDGTGVDLWARHAHNRSSQRQDENRAVKGIPQGEISGESCLERTSNKKKKKKWEPVSL